MTLVERTQRRAVSIGFEAVREAPRSFAWLSLLMSVCLLMALACSSDNRVGLSSVAASTSPEAITIRKHVTASVLVMPDSGDPSSVFNRIEIFPRTVVLDPRERAEMSAQALGASGRPLSDVEFVWVVTDPKAGSITVDGHFKAGRSAGVYTDAVSVTGVQKSREGVRFASESVSVTVVGDDTPRELTDVAILPRNLTVLGGQVFRLRAAAFDEDGLFIRGVQFVWDVSDPNLGRVNEVGYLTVYGSAGDFDGAVTVTGIWHGQEVSATADLRILEAPEADDFLNVQVLPQRFYIGPGDRFALSAVALNAYGEIAAGTELRWSIVDSRAGAIDVHGVFVAGGSPGVYTEAVKVEAIAPGEPGFVTAVDYASVVVHADLTRRLDRVGLLAKTVVVGPGGRAILVADPMDEFGEPAQNVAIAWNALEETVGVIDEQGYFKATGPPGIYHEALEVNVRQTNDNEARNVTRSETVDVIITGSLVSVDVAPALMAIAPGHTSHFSTTGRDQNGISLPGLVTRWNVIDGSAGTIDAFGNFTAGPTSGYYEDAISGEVIQTIRGRR